jgi:hypothetical protein
MKNQLKWSRGRWPAYVGFAFAALVLVGAVLSLMLGGSLLNGCGKNKVERSFAAAHPGSGLRIGKLDYVLGANRLVAQSLRLSTTNSTLKVGRISLTGVRWWRLLWGTAALADVLASATLDATNLEVEFPQAHYMLHCARLRASAPDSELLAEGTELRSLLREEDFFAAHDFRTTRFHLLVPECRVFGLAYGELLQGKSYRARSIHFSRPSFDALVNRDKLVEPFGQRPLMVHEALAAIPLPLHVDSLRITKGYARYRERVVPGADPGVLTFATVNMSAEGIANRGAASDTIRIRAQGNLMNAGVLKVQMTLPVTSPDFSLHYSGSLSAMALTHLDEFLDIAEHTRIKSGSAQAATFEIDVAAGQARGRVRALYKDLKIAVLDQQTGTEQGLGNRVASFLANMLKIRGSNAPDAAGVLKEGKVSYNRRPEDEFLQFAWFALRSGVLDAISR